MRKLIKFFGKSEAGAVTTEFLVLAAAIVGMGVVAFAGMGGEENVVNVEPDGGLEKFVAGF
ncbi:hypothetical protein [Planktotalea arctica]|uniref:hypothetical protein n=1 Tax=Planktotalea arctica TaxID=1481893 RepID=UPI000A1744CA|nr:hypothetical protein [Planktotalea arctica]